MESGRPSQPIGRNPPGGIILLPHPESSGAPRRGSSPEAMRPAGDRPRRVVEGANLRGFAAGGGVLRTPAFGERARSRRSRRRGARQRGLGQRGASRCAVRQGVDSPRTAWTGTLRVWQHGVVRSGRPSRRKRNRRDRVRPGRGGPRVGAAPLRATPLRCRRVASTGPWPDPRRACPCSPGSACAEPCGRPRCHRPRSASSTRRAALRPPS